jgi:hypothetical protein
MPSSSTQQAEQQMFRSDVVVLEAPRLVRRENDDLARAFVEALERGC